MAKRIIYNSVFLMLIYLFQNKDIKYRKDAVHKIGDILYPKMKQAGFENLYKGENSKSGTPILPSKRARKIPEKIQVSKEDLDELKASSEPTVESNNKQTEESEETDVSLDELSEAETKSNEVNQEDSETSNS